MKSLLRVSALLLVLTSFTVALTSPPPEMDWPQWRGPDRNGISKETGLLKQWPASGPAKVWEVSHLGNGYGSLSMKGDRLLVQGTQGGNSIVLCLNRNDGKHLWAATLGKSLEQDRGRGPRSTPTIDDDRVYALSENGDLACLKLADGAALWRRNILSDFGGSNPYWLLSESPLIDGNKVIVTPGGRQSTIVALDKMTGKTIWTTKELSDDAGYASAVVADVQGVRTIANFTAKAGVGVRASDGKLMWRYEQAANRTANCTTPLLFDNKAFFTSAYGTGCALLNLTAQSGVLKADEVYFNRDMKNHHGGVVLIGDYLYGFSDAILTCLEFSTGKTMWRDRSVGKGSLTYADGHLYLFGENNTVGLAEASPAGYKEKGRFTIPDQGLPSWAHPVIAGGRLYIRNQGTLVSYNIRAK